MLEEAALAARLSQADQKGWKSFIKESKEAHSKLLGTFETEQSQQIKKDTKAMAGFFQRLAGAKGKNQ